MYAYTIIRTDSTVLPPYYDNDQQYVSLYGDFTNYTIVGKALIILQDRKQIIPIYNTNSIYEFDRILYYDWSHPFVFYWRNGKPHILYAIRPIQMYGTVELPNRPDFTITYLNYDNIIILSGEDFKYRLHNHGQKTIMNEHFIHKKEGLKHLYFLQHNIPRMRKLDKSIVTTVQPNIPISSDATITVNNNVIYRYWGYSGYFLDINGNKFIIINNKLYHIDGRPVSLEEQQPLIQYIPTNKYFNIFYIIENGVTYLSFVYTSYIGSIDSVSVEPYYGQHTFMSKLPQPPPIDGTQTYLYMVVYDGTARFYTYDDNAWTYNKITEIPYDSNSEFAWVIPAVIDGSTIYAMNNDMTNGDFAQYPLDQIVNLISSGYQIRKPTTWSFQQDNDTHWYYVVSGISYNGSGKIRKYNPITNSIQLSLDTQNQILMAIASNTNMYISYYDINIYNYVMSRISVNSGSFTVIGIGYEYSSNMVYNYSKPQYDSTSGAISQNKQLVFSSETLSNLDGIVFDGNTVANYSNARFNFGQSQNWYNYSYEPSGIYLYGNRLADSDRWSSGCVYNNQNIYMIGGVKAVGWMTYPQLSISRFNINSQSSTIINESLSAEMFAPASFVYLENGTWSNNGRLLYYGRNYMPVGEITTFDMSSETYSVSSMSLVDDYGAFPAQNTLPSI